MRAPPSHILTNLIINIIRCQCRQETEKIPKYMDIERLKIPKDEESVSMDFQVCQPHKYTTLSIAYVMRPCHPYIESLPIL